MIWKWGGTGTDEAEKFVWWLPSNCAALPWLGWMIMYIMCDTKYNAIKGIANLSCNALDADPATLPKPPFFSLSSDIDRWQRARKSKRNLLGWYSVLLTVLLPDHVCGHFICWMESGVVKKQISNQIELRGISEGSCASEPDCKLGHRA